MAKILAQSTFTAFLLLFVIIAAGQCEQKADNASVPLPSVSGNSSTPTWLFKPPLSNNSAVPSNETDSNLTLLQSETAKEYNNDRSLNWKEYFSSPRKANWFNAARICALHGMQLATIESSEDYEQVKRGIDGLGYGGRSKYWLSGTDKGQGVNFFYWTTTGRSLSFTDWGSGEPNNWSEIEDCLHLERYIDDKGEIKYYWNDLDCFYDQAYFVCEKSYGALSRLS